VGFACDFQWRNQERGFDPQNPPGYTPRRRKVDSDMIHNTGYLEVNWPKPRKYLKLLYFSNKKSWSHP